MAIAAYYKEYLEAAKTLPGRGGRVKKASTLYLDKSRVNSHINPADFFKIDAGDGLFARRNYHYG